MGDNFETTPNFETTSVLIISAYLIIISAKTVVENSNIPEVNATLRSNSLNLIVLKLLNL
jgi:hypothetical protein